MRRSVPAHRPAAVAGLVATLLLVAAVLAAPVGAKEFLQARLDAPISFDSPPGAVLLVGATVETMSPDGLIPAEGQPVYLALTGRDGTTTRAAGAGDRRPAGHYTFEIVVPPGGVRDAEIGLHGSSDLPMMWGADPFTFRPMSADTAQLAPGQSGAVVAAPPPAAPVAAPVATAQSPTSSVAPWPVIAALVAGVAALGLAITALILLRRSRGAPSGRAADGAPGA